MEETSEELPNFSIGIDFLGPDPMRSKNKAEKNLQVTRFANLNLIIYFDQSQSVTSEWMSFASYMAASVVAKVLNDPTVFLEWPHYNQGKSLH